MKNYYKLSIRLACEKDYKFLYECSQQLRGKVSYNYQRFFSYCSQKLNSEFTQLWVCENESELVGYFIANKFAIPRYLGFGINIEEVAVLPKFQSNGIGKYMLKEYINKISNNLSIRKLTIHTDDMKIAGKLYEQFLTQSEQVEYCKLINPICE